MQLLTCPWGKKDNTSNVICYEPKIPSRNKDEDEWNQRAKITGLDRIAIETIETTEALKFEQ